MAKGRTYPVYIPSKARSILLQRTLPSWMAAGNVRVNVVVEPQDHDSYENVLWDMDLELDVSLRVLEKNDRGVAYARNGVIGFAQYDGADGFIMADDDVTVNPGVHCLAEFMEKNPHASGAGFMHRLHMLWMGAEYNTGPMPTTGGTAQNCVGLSTEKLSYTNGYNEKLGPYEDSDIIIQLTKAGYGPWFLHTDASGGMVGQRYQEGGIAEVERKKKLDRTEREEGFMRTLARAHGQEYFGWHKASRHLQEKGLERVIRFRWKRIYRDMNPDAFEQLYG